MIITDAQIKQLLKIAKIYHAVCLEMHWHEHAEEIRILFDDLKKQKAEEEKKLLNVIH